MKTKMKISKSRNGEEIPQIETIRSRSVIFQKACELDVKNSEAYEFDVKYRNFSLGIASRVPRVGQGGSMSTHQGRYSDLEDPIRRADRSSSDLVMKYAGCISIVLPFNIIDWWKTRLISDDSTVLQRENKSE